MEESCILGDMLWYTGVRLQYIWLTVRRCGADGTKGMVEDGPLGGPEVLPPLPARRHREAKSPHRMLSPAQSSGKCYHVQQWLAICNGQHGIQDTA